jgi:hypothetical protein
MRMSSAKFTIYELDAPAKLWEEAEEKRCMEAKREDGAKMSLTMYSRDENPSFSKKMTHGRLFGAPEIRPYNKTLLECLCNALQEVSSGIRKDFKEEEYKKPYTEQETTRDELPIELQLQLAQIGNLLQWMVNSASWRDGKYYPFDAFEIEQRLKYCQTFCSIALRRDNFKKHEPAPENVYPVFEPARSESVFKGAEALVVGKTLGELIDKAVEMIKSGDLPYEEKFCYVVRDGHFSLFSQSQLVSVEKE